MRQALSLTARAFALWWREIYLLTAINLAWFILQIPLITGPAATATLYAVAYLIAEDEALPGARGLWELMRARFFPSLGWGLANVLVFGVLAGNFWAYRQAEGLVWSLLRGAWLVIAWLWGLVNLYFWPFWQVQEDRSWKTTLRNSLIFSLKRPTLSITIFIVTLTFFLISTLLTVPLVAAFAAWASLLGVLAVREEILRLQGETA